MLLSTLVPWRKRRLTPTVRENHPLSRFHGEMDRMFDSFFSDFGANWPSVAELGSGGFSPRVDVKRNDHEVRITAELPGLDKDNIELKLVENHLLISGEKKVERESKEEDYYYMERSYGSFRREIPLGDDVDANRVEANFKNGVLEITIPRNPETADVKRIEVKEVK